MEKHYTGLHHWDVEIMTKEEVDDVTDMLDFTADEEDLELLSTDGDTSSISKRD